jgi:hypothetical protein
MLLGFAALLVVSTGALTGCYYPQRVVYVSPPPPPSYSEIGRRGYRDGSAAARRDINAGLPPDLNRHPRFRDPPVPPPAVEDYRHGFRVGYERIIHPAPPPPPPP